MRGPDFELGRVTEWRIGPDRVAHLALDGGSRWTIPPDDPQYAAVGNAIQLARRLDAPVFVSGDHRSGRLDRVALPDQLAPAHVAAEPVDGRLAVVFHGPPSPSYLRVDRPWFAKARALLTESAAQETASRFPPPLLVTIDIVTMEIMDVRQP